jgi:hypothetical protein
MNLPEPELNTYYDGEKRERVFYACEPMAFDNGHTLVVVPKRFISDGLSIPKLFQSLFSKSPSYIYAGILHDYTYRILPNPLTRKQADKLFLCWMKAYGVGFFTRRAIYRAVRLGARKSWRVNHPQFSPNNPHEL